MRARLAVSHAVRNDFAYIARENGGKVWEMVSCPYFAAEKLLGHEGMSALLWTHLDAVKGQLEPTVLAIAFVFLLVGYGTKVGLAPLHNWLPDAHAEGPTPVSAVLSGLLLNVALYAVIRCKVLVEGSIRSELPGQMLMAFGLAALSSCARKGNCVTSPPRRTWPVRSPRWARSSKRRPASGPCSRSC